ncbi:MAG: hypothetical protein ABI652_00630, partial [Acidobacteriota bacterium]
WVAPYIGDLIGYRPLHGVAAAVASPRAEVANTIAYRRRKGTAAMLEQLARDVTDWPARAVEFFEQLATSQYMNHVRLHASATANLRSTRALRQLDGPFNGTAHTAEMRRPESGSGRYNIPNIGIFLWRLEPASLTDVPLTPDTADAAGRRFRFNPLGADQPLFRLPITEVRISHIAEPANVPDAIDLRVMAQAVKQAAAEPAVADDYGLGESIILSRPNANPLLHPLAIATSDIRVCDLRDVAGGWAHAAALPDDKIGIDPRLGRVMLGANVTGPILATFHSGSARRIGGGEYDREPADVVVGARREARHGEPLQGHLDAIASGGRLLIGDSWTYGETPAFTVDAAGVNDPGVEVVVAARKHARPLIAAGGPIALEIGARGKLVLDGLVISGEALHVVVPAGDVESRELVLRHCTLVPGLTLNADGSAASPGAPSLVVDHPFTKVTLEQCVVGALRLHVDTAVSIVDCVIDAGDGDAVAYAGTSADAAGAEMTIRTSTVIGKAHVRVMRLASDTIFVAALATADAWPGPLWVERKQEGCMRFCVTPDGSLLPRHFHCVPDDTHPDATPHFTSRRYGDPGYMQLRTATDAAIREGASDGGEIGVMHALHQPQRESNLRLRLDEYLRFGLRAGIFYVN